MKERIKIVCRCKNCSKEFIGGKTTEEKLNNNGYQIATAVYPHPCNGEKGKVLGIGEAIRFEKD